MTLPAPRPLRRPAVDLAVDAGFAVLLLVSALRYFSRHDFAGQGILVLALAVGAAACYGVAVAGRLGASPARQRAGVLAATALWLPLAVIAPSFGWCAFALFLAVHRVLRGRAAVLLSATIVVAVSAGLFVMSEGRDLGLVLGPLFGGLVLSSAYAALDRAVAAQRSLIGELIDTREQLARSERDAGALAERGRVASELHDTVVQRTASALLLLESDDLRPGGSSAAVREARDSLRDTLGETRQLLHGLADPRESGGALAAGLAAQAREAGAAFAVVGTERALPDGVAPALQRVAQEALLNVAKHAGASTVRVTLTYFPDAVGMDVADDGAGFVRLGDRDAGTGAGFGLRAMGWRVENVGGRLTVESHPGQGTVVAAVVPAARDAVPPSPGEPPEPSTSAASRPPAGATA